MLKTTYILILCLLLFSCENEKQYNSDINENSRGLVKEQLQEDTIKKEKVIEKEKKTNIKIDTIRNNSQRLHIRIKYSNGDVYDKVYKGLDSNNNLGSLVFTHYKNKNNIIRSSSKYGEDFIIKKDSMNPKGELFLRIRDKDTLLVFDNKKFNDLKHSRFIYGRDTLYGYNVKDIK